MVLRVVCCWGMTNKINQTKSISIQQFNKSKMTIGTGTTLVGLINGMIGGIMLVVPVLSLDAGYVDQMVACILLAPITCYTAYLLVRHLGKSKNIKYLILNHFKGDHTYTTVYNIVIWFNFMGQIIIYFKLFCVQIQGLFDSSYQYIPEILAVFLVLWVIGLRQCDLTEIALASGITSIIGFVIFTFWMIQTAPDGEKSIQPYSPNSSVLILTLLNGYTIHDFMIQVITTNPNRKDYPKIIILLYIVSNFVFIFLCYSSSGLVNRTPGVEKPQTIIGFFENSKDQSWHLSVLEIMYVVHILTTFPEYLSISKVRVFQIFQIQHNQDDSITKGEAIYFIAIVAISYAIHKGNVSLNLLLNITGALLGYIFSLFIPILIHLKCVHYDYSSGYIAGDNERNLCILSNQSQCDIKYRSKTTLWIETAVLLFAVVFGGIYFIGSLGKELIKG